MQDTCFSYRTTTVALQSRRTCMAVIRRLDSLAAQVMLRPIEEQNIFH